MYQKQNKGGDKNIIEIRNKTTVVFFTLPIMKNTNESLDCKRFTSSKITSASCFIKR